MSQYHVYGVGNALVDMEYRLDLPTLEGTQLDKGVMTLMDEAQQDAITAHLDGHDCKMGAGGSVANSIIAVSQFGGKGFHTCKVASDELGQFYLQDLADNDVDSNPHPGDVQGHTGRCLVLVTPDADRTMGTFLGVTGDLSADELDPAGIAAAQFMYYEGYLASTESGCDAAIKARTIAEQHSTKTALSISDPNMVNFFRPALEAMIGDGVDLLFANEDEAKGITDSDTLDDAVEGMKKLAREFVITLGPRGALIYDGSRLTRIAGQAVDAVDTVGAGDMFAGAFLYALTHGWSHAEAGELAVAASAKLVTSYGPRISREESQGVLAEVCTQLGK